MPDAKYQLDADSEEIAHELLLVCQRHGIPIEDLTPRKITVGPSLFAVTVRLKVGAQLSAIERRLEDIMRDLGLGDRSHEVNVENAPEPSSVNFLIPRAEREIPDLPESVPQVVQSGAYLPIALGQTVTGDDYYSPVENWPHMLVAGGSGAGKTTFLRSVLIQLARFPEGMLELIVVDGKGDSDYIDVVPGHVFSDHFPEPILGHERVSDVLEWVLEEMERRRDKLHEYAKAKQSRTPLKWPDIYRAQVT